ncbi:MAG: hypothetical protein PVF47_17540, partial [Anaerolineae bacterium]
MSTNILVRDAPEIPGLAFRGFRGEADYPAMSAVINGSKEADGLEWANTVDDVARTYDHLSGLDPRRDMLFAEVEGGVIGYSRVWSSQEDAGTRLYRQFVHLLPAWRKNGLRRAMLRHNERRLRQVAGGHPDDGPRFFEAWASATESHWSSLLESEGYRGVRYSFEMLRPDLDNIPDRPLPEGLEVRPVEPDQIPQIWAAAKEAFRDHWGFSEEEWDRELREWREAPTFQPHLWQVAWEGDQVAGMVQNFVNEAENEEYGR